MTSLKLHRHLLAFAALTLAASTSLLQAQTYTDLHDFDGTDGCCSNYPSLLAQGQDGDIYGATTTGGTSFRGNIFKITPSGTFTNLHNFSSTDGASPQGGLSMGTDGIFYGTTYQGGAHSAGTIFKITSSGTLTTLYSFSNGTDGAFPRTPPVQAQDGNLYGTTGNGTVAVLYKLTTSGTFTVMATLAAQSYSPLLLGTDGNLYGSTVFGGTFNAGTVFQFAPSTKKLKTLFNFHNESSPFGPLMQATDGALYGTTSAGGTGSGGVVFKITTAGAYTVLTNFSTSSSANGDRPFAGLVQGSDKFLYGVCSAGGANGVGTLFKISTTGTGLTVVHDFSTSTGDTPYATTLLHTNGKIYGSTFHGGSHTSDGVFYSMDVSLKPFVAPVVLHSAKGGSSVEVLGQGFNTATKVLFGTGAGSFTINSDTFLTTKIITGGTTGFITVDEPGGNLVSLQKFKLTPVISSFAPTSGPAGTSVVITGTSLLQASNVKFGGVAATVFTVNSDTKVTATVPTAAVTGKISITTPGGTANSSGTFTVQ